MTHSSVYWIAAGAVALVVLILLILWNVRQLHKTSDKKSVKVTPKAPDGRDREMQPDVQADVQTNVQAELQADAQNEVQADAQADAQGTEAPVDPVKKAESIENIVWASDVVPEQTPPIVLKDFDGTETDFSLSEDHVIRMSSYEDLQPETDSNLDSDEEENSDRTILTEPFDDFAKGVDDVVQRSDELVDNPREWLQGRLQSSHILGWFTLSEQGNVKFSDQSYDSEVYRHFAQLLQSMMSSTELVGMSNWQEFVLRGEEGVILIMSAPKRIMAKEDYIVVFLDEEKAVPQVISQLLEAI